MQPNAVSAWALENEVELLRPERGPDSKTLARMRELGVDIIIVMAYGCILKKEVLNFDSVNEVEGATFIKELEQLYREGKLNPEEYRIIEELLLKKG